MIEFTKDEIKGMIHNLKQENGVGNMITIMFLEEKLEK